MSNPDDSQRVVITGIGVVSPIGIGKDAFWKGLEEGRSGIKPLTLFDVSLIRSKLAGEITEFKPEDILGPRGLRNLDRTTKISLCASKLCLDDADYHITEENSNRTGVVLGLTTGHLWSISEFDKERIRNGQSSVNPALFPNTVMNSPAAQIAIHSGIRGFNTTISTGFASSLDALDYARNFILFNRADAVLVGGVEALSEHLYKGFYKIGLLSGFDGGNEQCSPFDKNRNGTILGEGAVMFMLESVTNAKKRGATIYAEYRATGVGYDKSVYNRYRSRSSSLAFGIDKALSAARLSMEEIDYVSSSANSTIMGDLSEARTLKSVFAKKGSPPLVSSCKSMIGETFSAGGSFQIGAGLMALTTDTIPPTINYKYKDNFCDIDCVPNVARKIAINNVLVPILGPTGQTTVGVVSKYLS
jgi:3-oxoacyl-[acyl-carrier-protein] synthase II